MIFSFFLFFYFTQINIGLEMGRNAGNVERGIGIICLLHSSETYQNTMRSAIISDKVYSDEQRILI